MVFFWFLQDGFIVKMCPNTNGEQDNFSLALLYHDSFRFFGLVILKTNTIVAVGLRSSANLFPALFLECSI